MALTQEERIALANGKQIDKDYTTSSGNTVKIPAGQPTSDWDYDQLSAYYERAKSNLDPRGMEQAHTMANYLRSLENKPTTNASDDISAMYMVTQGTKGANPGSWIGSVRNQDQYLSDRLYEYQQGAYKDTPQSDYYNYVKGLAQGRGLLNEGGNPTNSYYDNLSSRQGYYTNEGNREASRGNKGFSYNADNDPLWQAYLDRYKQESDRAARNTIGEVSANTGGLASSYATTAANQAANYYTQQANDAFMDIYQQKYNEYLNQLEQQNYLNEQAYNRQYNAQQLAMAAEQAEFARQQALWEQQYNQANADWERAYKEALLAAEYGDFSKLKAMGIDTGSYQAQLASGGRSSGGRSSGSGKPPIDDTPIDDTVLVEAQAEVDRILANAVKRNKVLTNYEWNYLVNTLNVDAQLLIDNDFKKQERGGQNIETFDSPYAKTPSGGLIKRESTRPR